MTTPRWQPDCQELSAIRNSPPQPLNLRPRPIDDELSFQNVARFCFSRASRDPFGTRVRLRFLGTTAATATKLRNLSRQSSIFFPWSLYRWLDRTSSPRSLIRRAHPANRRARTSSGIEGLAAADHRSTAFDATLLTFCPPGPELRTKENRISRRGIESCALMRRAVDPVMRAIDAPGQVLTRRMRAAIVPAASSSRTTRPRSRAA